MGGEDVGGDHVICLHLIESECLMSENLKIHQAVKFRDIIKLNGMQPSKSFLTDACKKKKDEKNTEFPKESA